MNYGEDDDDDREGSGSDDFETEVVREEHAPVDKDVINVVCNACDYTLLQSSIVNIFRMKK